jgi:hypothetical protein
MFRARAVSLEFLLKLIHYAIGPVHTPAGVEVGGAMLLGLDYSETWWAQQDSNLRPADYESVALPLRHGPCFASIIPEWLR